MAAKRLNPMRVSILAVGQMRGTDEAALYGTYAKRIAQAGRRIGLDGLHVTEIKEQSGADDRLAAHLAERTNTFIIALDETGKDMNSRQLAGKIGAWRDDGCRELVFVIGAADGLRDDIRHNANLTLSLGRMTWPHMLARVLLAEQIYRAISILSGHPYHRD